MPKKEKWIATAIEKPGALTSYVRRVYGSAGFVKTDGVVIRQSVLRELAEQGGTVGKRARLALTLRKLRK